MCSIWMAAATASSCSLKRRRRGVERQWKPGEVEAAAAATKH